MSAIINITAPIFLLIALGFVIVRFEWLKREHIQALGVFVLKIGLPMVIVNALMQKDLSQIWQPQYFIAYATGSLVACAAALWWYRWHWKQPLHQAAIMAMGASMSNTGFIGFGVLSMVLGAPAAVYFSMTLMIENLLMLPLILTLIEWGQNGNKGLSLGKIMLQTLKKVAQNPLVLGLATGLMLSALHIRLFTPVQQVLQLVGQCAAPMALLVIGGSLVGTSVQAAGPHALVLSVLKLIVMPSVVWLVFQMLPNVSTQMQFAGVLLSSISMATIFSLFGQQHQLGARSAAVLLITTLLMFVSVSWVLWALPHA